MNFFKKETNYDGAYYKVNYPKFRISRIDNLSDKITEKLNKSNIESVEKKK